MTKPYPSRRAILGIVTATAGWIGSRRAAVASEPSASGPSPQTQPVAQAPEAGVQRLAADVAAVMDRQLRGGVSLSAFGFKGDGKSDDTAAWRGAIAFASEHKIRNIFVPAGISLVREPIVDAANPLPSGLTFTGEGATFDSPYGEQSRLKYTGTGACWEVAYPTGGPATAGRWAWVAMTFECTNPAGTMFSFGDPEHHVPYDDPRRDPHRFLQGISFKDVLAFGGRGTGDFLRACKAFELSVDPDCAIYSFRRAFWLKGCDNCTIRSRMVGNNTAVRIEKAGNFGNNNRIDVHYIGSPDQSFGGEPCYAVWDNGRSTTIEKGMLLEGTAPRAHFFLNGYGTTIHSPDLGMKAPFFELAPDAQEIAVYSPRCPIFEPANAPIVHPPANPNFGDYMSDHRIRILDAPHTIQAILPEHPRILLSGAVGHRQVHGHASASQLLVGANGLQPASHICTALNYWGRQGSPGGGGIKGFVRDPVNHDRWAIHLTRDGPVEQGIGLQFVVGADIQPGMFRLVNRMRLASGTSNAGWVLIAAYDGAFFSNAFTFATASTYVTHDNLLDLSAVAYGKTVSIHLYNSSAGRSGVDLFVEAIGLFPVLAPVGRGEHPHG